jgi:hypothetical protein
MKGVLLFVLFTQSVFAGQNYLTHLQFQTILDQHTILKKYKNKAGLFRFRKEVPGKIKFQSYYFFDTRDLFLKKQGAIFYLVNEENGPKEIVFETTSKTKYKCLFKNEPELIKKIIQGKYPPHLLTEDNCSSDWSHPVTELKKFMTKKMQRYRQRKGGQSLGVNKVTLKGKNTIVQRIIPTTHGKFFVEKVLYPRSFISYLAYLKEKPIETTSEVLIQDYKIQGINSLKDPKDITLEILNNNENTMNELINKRIIIR